MMVVLKRYGCKSQLVSSLDVNQGIPLVDYGVVNSIYATTLWLSGHPVTA
jgi:hypothetical protein